MAKPERGTIQPAQPLRRETRKSMSRRSGQDSSPFKAGKWWRVRVRFDEPGVEARKHRSLKVCPVALRLSRPEIERRAAEVIATSGANSAERFARVVLGEGVTFMEQAKIYLREAVSRNRKPIKNPTTIEGSLRKWINPTLGDLTLSMVDNLSVKPLVKKLVDAGKSPRTVEKYVEFVKQIVKSLKAPNGEPLYPRTWNSEVMDLPVVVYRKQRRPALSADGVTKLIASAKPGQMRVLFVLLGATGMRISEALALEARHFIHDGRTILVEQQVDKDHPVIVPYVKTDASYRQIDLPKDVAAYLKKYVSHKTGLTFHTNRNTPHLYHNLETRWLDPRLASLGLSEMSWHSFRRYRNSWLRSQRTLPDLLKFWLGHKPTDMSEVYSGLRDDLKIRWEEVERVGVGFSLPKEVVPNVPKKRLFVVSQKTPATGILGNRMSETRGV